MMTVQADAPTRLITILAQNEDIGQTRSLTMAVGPPKPRQATSRLNPQKYCGFLLPSPKYLGSPLVLVPRVGYPSTTWNLLRTARDQHDWTTVSKRRER